MSDGRPNARALLRAADARLDEALLAEARAVATAGFAGGGDWMARVLGGTLPAARARHLGIVKYGLASLGGGLVAAALAGPAGALALVPAILAFYAIEAQMVFLFPVAIRGSQSPFRDAFRLTRRAGGTLAVMAVVLPVAATMVFGAPFRGGFVRAWTLGCLAIVLYFRAIEEERA